MNPCFSFAKKSVFLLLSTALVGCIATAPSPSSSSSSNNHHTIYGTDNNYASQAIYFLLTDRFVDGDPSNNHINQGGEFASFDRPLLGEDGQQANVGYLGGDFQGVLNNGQYIKDMGFTSVWLTPIYDNPDQAFNGGEEIKFGEMFKDGGKTGYHGYWGVNFFKVDEHLVSEELNFQKFTGLLESEFQLDFVLDIVGNHGSPSYTLKSEQAKFGQLYDQNDNLVADHQNLHPEKLSDEPLHQFFNKKPDIAQLSDLNENNPAVLQYFTDAYLKWLAQGADAIRIDTIKHMPHHFWKKLTDNLREVHPELFIFAESYSYDADFIAEHTQPQNGGVSVLDFPGRKAITAVFENPESDYQDILSYLHLTDGTYQNPYELMTFYDNHDMARMNTSDQGFIDANNWLFTARGIPVIYYGSEINFMTGKAEHQGNRNYLGQANIEKAKTHVIHQALTNIANIRKNSVALQKGKQINLTFNGDSASFYRVYQNKGTHQTALVLLNKSNQAQLIKVDEYVNQGQWVDAFNQDIYPVAANQQSLAVQVPAHGVKVLLLNQPLSNDKLLARLIEK